MIQSLEDLIVPGRILRLFCSFTDPPKEEFVVVVAIISESMTLEVGIAKIIIKNLTGS